MDKNAILEAIRDTPLTNEDLSEILAETTKVLIGNGLVSAGLDMLKRAAKPEAAA